MKTTALEDLINEYLDQVNLATKLLQEKFGTTQILGLWHSKKITRTGKLTKDTTYELHGVGCRIYIESTCIDFDYGPDNRTDGFDAWRLYIYACERSKKYKAYTNLEKTEEDLKKYISSGRASQIENSTSSLYFLNHSREALKSKP